MTRAIFYKEWIKLRWLLAGISGVFVALVPYLIVNLHSKFRFAGHAHLWAVIADKDSNLISQMHYLPLLAGILLGVFQFVPEMNKRSLKLTLHLPHPEKLTILKMLFFGVASLLVIFTITGGFLFFFLHISLPPAILNAWFVACIPWYVAGVTAYLMIAWVSMEPTWKQRVINSFIALSFLAVILRDAGSFSYLHAMPLFGALILLGVLFPFYSVYRFKEGCSE